MTTIEQDALALRRAHRAHTAACNNKLTAYNGRVRVGDRVRIVTDFNGESHEGRVTGSFTHGTFPGLVLEKQIGNNSPTLTQHLCDCGTTVHLIDEKPRPSWTDRIIPTLAALKDAAARSDKSWKDYTQTPVPPAWSPRRAYLEFRSEWMFKWQIKRWAKMARRHGIV